MFLLYFGEEALLIVKVGNSELPKAFLSKRGLVHNHSYENEFNFHVNEISFSYERMSTKTRFEKEAKGNSEMAYYYIISFTFWYSQVCS